MVADSARSWSGTRLIPRSRSPQHPASHSPVDFNSRPSSSGWWCGTGAASHSGRQWRVSLGAAPSRGAAFRFAFSDRHLRRCSARLVLLARATTRPGGTRPSERTCAVVPARRRVSPSGWDGPFMWHAESQAGRRIDKGPPPRLSAHSWWPRGTAPRPRWPSGGRPFNREAVRGAVTPSDAHPRGERGPPFPTARLASRGASDPVPSEKSIGHRRWFVPIR